MRKAAGILFVIFLCFALVACGDATSTEQPQANEQPQTNEQSSDVENSVANDSGEADKSGNDQVDAANQESNKPSLSAEKIREAYIDYNNYDLVAIDSYGGDAASSLGYFEYTRPGSEAESDTAAYYDSRDIAIIGEISALSYHSALTGKDYKIADKFGNKILVIKDDISGDKSYITFKDAKGYEYLLDMFGEEEQFETILVKGDHRQLLGTNDREARPGDRIEPTDYSNQTVIELSKLINGDSIGGGLIIRNIEYDKPWEKAKFTLEGNIELAGKLYWEGDIAGAPIFAVDESTFPTALIIGDPKDSPFGAIEYKPVYIYFTNSDVLEKNLSQSALEQIKIGGALSVKINVRDIGAIINLGSESAAYCEYIEIVEQTPAAGTEESDTLKLSGLKNENINGTQVNYSDYRVVVVPMYDGVNSLYEVTQDIGSVTQGPQGMQVSFAIFGHLNDIKITYYEGMESAGETIDVGTLFDSNVNVRVWLPNNDMSHIMVTGVAELGNGVLQNVEFSLDDMRDSSEYDVLMFE